MTQKLQNRPILFSVVFTLVIAIGMGITQMLIRALFVPNSLQLSATLASVAWIVLSIVAVMFLGAINQINGFKFVFSSNGFAKGILACVPLVVFFAFNLIVRIINVESMTFENPGGFTMVALMQAIAAFLQNIVFRGLLITALFVKYSEKENDRVKSILKASALYLLAYIPLSILNTGGVELMQLVNTFVVGAGMCGAYMYSKNLLSLTLVQGVWHILGVAIDFFGIEESVQASLLMLAVLLNIWVIIIVGAVVFGKRAKVFSFLKAN